MTTVEEVICKAKELAQTAGKKTGELVNLGKLKLEIAETQRDISARYELIGRYMYEASKNGVSVEERLPALYEKIDALKEKVAELERQMDELRHTKSCNDCGKSNPKDAAYCQKCGKSL